jgi:hypothetical protein
MRHLYIFFYEFTNTITFSDLLIFLECHAQKNQTDASSLKSNKNCFYHTYCLTHLNTRGFFYRKLFMIHRNMITKHIDYCIIYFLT